MVTSIRRYVNVLVSSTGDIPNGEQTVCDSGLTPLHRQSIPPPAQPSSWHSQVTLESFTETGQTNVRGSARGGWKSIKIVAIMRGGV